MVFHPGNLGFDGLGIPSVRPGLDGNGWYKPWLQIPSLVEMSIPFSDTALVR
jgi:hypothetical protein